MVFSYLLEKCVFVQQLKFVAVCICERVCSVYCTSMAVEPLYPLVCARNASTLTQCRDDPLSPMAVAASLINLPCPLVFKYKDNIGVIQLITEV